MNQGGVEVPIVCFTNIPMNYSSIDFSSSSTHKKKLNNKADEKFTC